VQAYPKYGSEKKGLPTTYYLTISNNHILLHSELNDVDLVVLNDTTALFSGNPLVGLVKGGSVIMQSIYTEPADVWQRIPEHHKKTIKDKKIRVFYADMVQIAREVASVADLQMRMQGIVLLGAFLKLTPYGTQSNMNADQVYAGVEKALRKYFGKRGDRVVQDNMNCVKRGYEQLREVPQEIIQKTREAVTV
jgi:pyruvate-ferredoxin/flavodoxin oxidoreductase